MEIDFFLLVEDLEFGKKEKKRGGSVVGVVFSFVFFFCVFLLCFFR